MSASILKIDPAVPKYESKRNIDDSKSMVFSNEFKFNFSSIKSRINTTDEQSELIKDKNKIKNLRVRSAGMLSPGVRHSDESDS